MHYIDLWYKSIRASTTRFVFTSQRDMTKRSRVGGDPSKHDFSQRLGVSVTIPPNYFFHYFYFFVMDFSFLIIYLHCLVELCTFVFYYS